MFRAAVKPVKKMSRFFHFFLVGSALPETRFGSVLDKIYYFYVSGFFGTHIMYNHQDVLFAPFCDRTFKLKKILHAGKILSHVPIKVFIERIRFTEILNSFIKRNPIM